jgi:hypothetical protein
VKQGGPFSEFVKKHMLEDPEEENKISAVEKNTRVGMNFMHEHSQLSFISDNG